MQPMIFLHGSNARAQFQKRLGNDAESRANFEDSISPGDVCMGKEDIENVTIHEEILPKSPTGMKPEPRHKGTDV